MDTAEQAHKQSTQVEDTISFLDVLRVLVKHRWFIVTSTLIGALFIVVIALYTKALPNTSRWNILPNEFTPTASVRLLQSPSNAFNSNSQGGGTTLAGLLTGTNTAANGNAEFALALLHGDTLADEVVNQLGFVKRFHLSHHPTDSARSMFRNGLKVGYNAINGIITISYTDINKDFATKVVNATIDVLQRRFNALNLEQVAANATYLRGRVATAQKDVERAQNRLIDFMRKYGIVDLASQSQAQTSEILNLNQQIQSKQIQLATLEKYGRTQNDPSVRQLNTDIGVLQNLLDQIRTGAHGFHTVGNIPADQLPQISAEYEALKADVATQQSVLGLVQQQYLTSKLQENAATKTLQVVERARPPEYGSKPNRRNLAMVFTILVFLAAILVSFLVEYFEKARRDPVQAQKLSEIRESLGRTGVTRERS